MKITNGTATVYAEALHKTKVGHWETREGRAKLRMRKSGELLKRCDLHRNLPVRIRVVFDAEKRLRQFLLELLQFFVSVFVTIPRQKHASPAPAK